MSLLRSGQPDPRWGDWGERLKGLFLYGLLQKRQPRYFWAGLIHFLIFGGFVVLGLRSLDLIVQGLGGGYVLPFLKRRVRGLSTAASRICLSCSFWAPVSGPSSDGRWSGRPGMNWKTVGGTAGRPIWSCP